MNDYSDIIKLSRPQSKYPKMSLKDRAKIFAPFAALVGYGEEVKKKEFIYDHKIELSEEESNIINDKLSLLKKKEVIKVTYFKQIKNDYGKYIYLEGEIEKIDKTYLYLVIDKERIDFIDILDIEEKDDEIL